MSPSRFIKLASKLIRGSRFWELSQNVDRFTDTAPSGIIGCLTPSGIPFATSRGGPITGLEAMSLQGLPIDQMLLTRESQRELLDLAGNAMSSTVVGAAILAGLMVGGRALEIDDEEMDDEPEVDLASRDIPEPYKEMDERALGQSETLNLLKYGQNSVKTLHEQARNSIRLCYCEGPVQITELPILVCQECNHTACQKCAGIPSHSYEPMSELAIRSRIKPSEFIKAIKAELPMRLKLFVEFRTREHLGGTFKAKLDQKIWKKYSEAVDLALGEELRFQAVTRTHNWVITYEGRNSHLSLTFSEHHVVWQLKAKPNAKEPANSELRKLLMRPFASMQVRDARDLLSGRWQFFLPTTRAIDLTIDGLGELTKCWESKLGIEESTVVDKEVWPMLQISVNTDGSSQLGNEISGKYQLLQNCGMASGSLHKKISNISRQEPVYLFLDPDRYGKPEKDCFVFSTEINRLAYQESRTIIASMDPLWRPSNRISDTTTCKVFSEETSCEAQLRTFATDELPTCEVLSENIDDVVATDLEIYSSLSMSCQSKVHTILSCKVPLETFEDLGWEQGGWKMVDQIQERQTFAMFAWLTERVRTLSGFSARWRELKSPGTSEICRSCAPKSPDIKWKVIQSGQQDKFIPFEDEQQAGAFERSIKARPAPFITYTRIDEERLGRLMIGLNIGTLVHRALAKFSSVAGDERIKVSWRLDSQYEWPIKTSFPAFELKSNKTDAEREHIFKGISEHLELRREQRRSLAWMLGQESPKAPVFHEQETEEAILAAIGWRAEVRATRPSSGRGGVLTDEVGYGKTITTLALIAKRMQSAIKSTENHVPEDGRIPVQATLIIVPKTLIAQWTRQIQTFLGRSCIFIVIKTMTDLNSLSVKKVKEAHIILLAWSIFSSTVYPPKIAAFAAMPEGPNAGGRAFKSWIEEASKRVGQNTKELKNCEDVSTFLEVLHEKLAKNIKENEVQKSVPTKRLRGAAYVAAAATKGKGKQAAKSASSSGPNIDSFKLNEASCLDEMKSPPLQMFHFHRLVVDEYTYVSTKEFAYVNSFKSTYRWVLSGTPRLGDFADVKVLAGFLGVHLGEDDDCSSILQKYSLKQLRENRTGK